MIPVKLTMRNFMCYRDDVPPLSFEGLHLACLSGENGSGKSALIDAMTWALWGRARASSDDDLIAAGRAEMEVDFEFAVGQQLYRIVRRRSRPRRPGGAGQSALELQVKNGDSFRSITGNTIAQTQQKIIGTLHMDYDTFINSAYLRQGHADEFTIKRPAERKQVLADILGLSLYDALEERARELARRKETERAPLEGSISDISDELTQKPAYEAELEQVQGELSRIEAVTREKETGLNELRQRQDALQNKKAQMDELEVRIRNTANDLERWQAQAEQHRSHLREYEAIISRRQAIEEGYARFTQDRKINEELDRKFRDSVNLQKTQTQLDKKIQDGLNSLKTEHAVTQSKIDEFENKTRKLPELKNRLNQAQAQLRQLAEPETALKQKTEDTRDLQACVNGLKSEKARLEREIGETAEKLDLLSSRTQAECPLCGTELTQEGLEHITANYTAEKQGKSDLLKSIQAELAQKQAELDARQEEVSQMESQLNAEKTRAQSQAEIIRNEMTAIEDAERQLTGLRDVLADIEQRLAKRDFAVAEQAALAAIEAELAGLGYDAEKHEQVRQQMRQLEPYDQDRQRLDEAEKLIQQEKAAALTAEEEMAKLRRSLELDNQKRETLQNELIGLPRLLSDLAGAEDEYRSLAAQQSQAQEAVGSVRAKLQRLAELEIKRKEKEELLAQVAREEDIYKELVAAFGKRGVQAMLIETAFPEVEAEANRLLARMTDNRMHVKFETQREAKTKKGNVVETLDITITDELGIPRNYEMFSGGEAFRINFAIRVALSRLLARRAGAPLRTLIIDEGFGTQDVTGLEKLKEAINSIQGDFDKLLVITHVEELRDAFPTRIDVIKNTEGSTISVS
jgi:exonuclease SbcC